MDSRLANSYIKEEIVEYQNIVTLSADNQLVNRCPINIYQCGSIVVYRAGKDAHDVAIIIACKCHGLHFTPQRCKVHLVKNEVGAVTASNCNWLVPIWCEGRGVTRFYTSKIVPCSRSVIFMYGI